MATRYMIYEKIAEGENKAVSPAPFESVTAATNARNLAEEVGEGDYFVDTVGPHTMPGDRDTTDREPPEGVKGATRPIKFGNCRRS